MSICSLDSAIGSAAWSSRRQVGAQERFLRLEQQAEKSLAIEYLELDFRAGVWIGLRRTGAAPPRSSWARASSASLSVGPGALRS
jgi:hypothetical protein